jgi:hypothetical protein
VTLPKKTQDFIKLGPLDFGFYVSNKDYKSRSLSTVLWHVGFIFLKIVFWITWMGT